MKALNRKLWRDLWRMKGQVFAITLVVISGAATFIMFISTMDSLTLTRNTFLPGLPLCRRLRQPQAGAGEPEGEDPGGPRGR